MKREKPYVLPGVGALLVAVSAIAFVLVLVLAVAHVDDRYDVGGTAGVWMGLAAAVRHGQLYPAVYAHGFYGGTRYMPLPMLLEAGVSFAGGGYLVPAKASVFAISVALLYAAYVAARRRGAPAALSAAVTAAILASWAMSSSALSIRWDQLATLLQLLVLMLMGERITTRRSLGAGVLCALAIMSKFSALWAPAALGVWLAWHSRRQLLVFFGALVVSLLFLGGLFEGLSDGRFLHNIWTFAFAGSGHAPALEGVHRLYELAFRNEQSLPLFLLAGFLALMLAVGQRRVELYELALVFLVPILLVVMRDEGAYENHLIDLELLCGLVLAGAWRTLGSDRRGAVGRLAIAASLIVAVPVALRYSVVPDARAALKHGVFTAGGVYKTNPLPQLTASGTCTLFEDASIPILAGQRPVVLDAFIAHRLQTVDPAALDLLVRRVDEDTFGAIVLDFPLSNLGWFATQDFGTKLAESMRAHYRLASVVEDLYVYRPIHPARRAASCGPASIDSWS